MMRRARAFSLIELMVVIGIIGILIALLLPTLSAVRAHAIQLKCAAQLHQIGIGLANYTVAFKGHYPACSDWQVYGGKGDGDGDDSNGLGWTEEIEPYCAKASTGLYHCPGFPPETEFNYFLGIHFINVTENRMDLTVSDVRRASEYVLSGDCTHARLYPPPFGQARLYLNSNDCDKDDALWNCLKFFGEQYGMNAHRAGNNVLFGDYHVACYAKFDPRYMTYDPGNPGVSFDDIRPEPDN